MKSIVSSLLKVVICLVALLLTECRNRPTAQTINKADTCIIIKGPIGPAISAYVQDNKDLKQFYENDQYPFQLIYLVFPVSENYVYKVQAYLRESTLHIYQGTDFRNCYRSLHIGTLLDFDDKLAKVESGGHYNMCEYARLHGRYYLFMIKTKSTIIFQYQGFNRDFSELPEKERKKIQNAIALYAYLKNL